jgi:hypothetical protein
MAYACRGHLPPMAYACREHLRKVASTYRGQLFGQTGLLPTLKQTKDPVEEKKAEGHTEKKNDGNSGGNRSANT